MEHRPSRLPWICLLWIFAMTAPSFGQLPSSIYTSADPTPDRPTIDHFVQVEATKLAGADYPAWGSARGAIVGEAARQGITQGFLDVYADSVNKNLLPLTQDKDPRHRLNVAIIVARVAAKANNAKLLPITEALLHDSCDAVVLWGLQSAKYIVPLLVQTGNTKDAVKLGKLVAEAAKDHITPATVEEAYRALVLDPNAGTDKASEAIIKALGKDAIQAYLPAPIAYYQYRVKLYDGAEPPVEPTADNWGSSFFIKASVWDAQSPQQRAQVLKAMLGLLQGAAKQNAVAKSPEMFDLVKRTGQAFDVAGTLLKNSPLEKAAHNVSSVPNDVGADDLDAKIKAVEEILKGLAP